MRLGPFSNQDHVQISSLGIEFAVAVLSGTALGFWIDRTWGTFPWMCLLGAAVGFSLGFYTLCRATQLAGKHKQSSKEKKENGRS